MARSRERATEEKEPAAGTEAAGSRRAAAAAPAPLPEEDASDLLKKAAALTRKDSSIHRCQHVRCGQSFIDLGIALIKASVDPPLCEAYDCGSGSTEGEGSSILDCGRIFCAGHARQHALSWRHLVALMHKRPNVACCFGCDDSYFISNVRYGDTVGDNDGLTISALKKDEKGMMMVGNEAGGHASEKTEVGSGGGSMEVLTSDVSPQRCNHVYKKSEVVRVIKRIMLSDIASTCSDSTFDNTTGRSMILVCLGCEKPFCNGHADTHAKSTKHWNYLIYRSPYLVCCFVCKGIVFLAGKDKEDLQADNATAGHGSESFIEHAHAIKGMPNLGNTCYLNSLVQCLHVLGRLRARMLRLDPTTGGLGAILRHLFDDTDNVNNAKGLLDPSQLWRYFCFLFPMFRGTSMQDSHEALCYLLNGLDMDEAIMNSPNMQDGVPTVSDSIFGGQLSVTTLRKCCSFHSVSHDVFHNLSVPLPLKKSPAKIIEIPEWVTKGRRSQLKRNIEKTRTIAEHGDSQNATSELKDVVMVKTSEPLEVDSTIVEQTSQSKDVVQGPLQTSQSKDVTTANYHIPEDLGAPPPVSPLREDDARTVFGIDAEKNGSAVQPEVSTETEVTTSSRKVTSKDNGKSRSGSVDINSLASIEECLELHFKVETIEWTCENCSKVDQKPDIILGNCSEHMMSSTSEEGGRGKQAKLHPSADQVEEKQNEQKDRNKGAIRKNLISKLPPVLAIHLKRSLRTHKVMGHVSFKEILDVGQFMDPSSEEKDNSRYRLVAVIEHQGFSLNSGHFLAYARPNPPQQTNGSSSWFCASDAEIKEISFEEVLKCEAYLLFYERIEG
uniref:Ubiquitin carboxyl-terminal hydrolase n=1 Tax=Leersia perrieri TaxID=77586 RepID=A0A0D9XA17_9ORYZ